MSANTAAALLRVTRDALRGSAWVHVVHESLVQLLGQTEAGVAAFYTATAGSPGLTLHERLWGHEPLAPLEPLDALARIDLGLAEAAAAEPGEPREYGSWTGVQTRFDLGVAVRYGKHTFGALTIGSGHGQFPPHDRGFVCEMAATIALALHAERRARVAKELYARSRFVFDNNPNPMLMLDAQTFRYVDVNQTAIDVYGYTREQFLTMTPRDLRAPGHEAGLEEMLEKARHALTSTIDTVHRRADGTRLDVHLSSITVKRESGSVRIATVQDMTERNEALARALQSERQLEHDALHDRMTGLPNRALLDERLRLTIEAARASGHTAAVLFIDVDRFKSVNDTMGHAAGDVLLAEIARRLRAGTRESDCVARNGGDEFVAMLGDVADARAVEEIAHQLGQAVAHPIAVPGGESSVTCSIGIALFPGDGDDAETLIRNADAAMYQAKRSGRATTRFFTGAMQHVAEQRTRLDSTLRRAIDAAEFELVYQPIYTLDGALIATEALLRWPQADGTVIVPDAFVPYAEESGLIIPIGAWVLRTACFANAAWARASQPIVVNVNVSAKQLADPQFVRTVQQALADSGLEPALLELELTETAMSTNVERTAAVVRTLREIGVRIAVDDFGTGYNSLATLRSYEVDTLKLAMCFVHEIAASAVDQAIASAVITAAHGLGAKVVAEGVETAFQRAMLSTLHCDAAQGFLFGPAMDADRFGDVLQADMRGRRNAEAHRRRPRPVVPRPAMRRWAAAHHR